MSLKRSYSEANGSRHEPDNAPANAIIPSKHQALRERFMYDRELPLNMILLVTAQLDDIADISRVTRTSRLLYYMTLPKLWENVTLRPYSQLRYKNGRPEGYGGGSPFSMALEALVSRNVATYVKSFKLVGDWREMDTDEFSRGRVPDNTMMLNIAIRAALDKMDKLQSFSWELDTKPLGTIYQALASKKTLTSLTLKFPSKRIPRPTTLIPPIPSLKSIYLYNVDPLCYPDDVSLLFASSPILEEMKIEWNPRIRREREPSVSLAQYFGRAALSKVCLPIKRVAYKNMYTRNDPHVSLIIDLSKVESVTLFNCMNPGDPSTVFYDDTWRGGPNGLAKLKALKKLRLDVVPEDMPPLIAEMSGLEEFYLVSRHPTNSELNSSSTDGSPTANANSETSARTGEGSTPTTPLTPYHLSSVAIASDFLAAISGNHGSSLKILLLSDEWRFSKDVLINLVKSCPNMQQLGVAVEGAQFDTVRALLLHRPSIWAFRILEAFGPRLHIRDRTQQLGETSHHMKSDIMDREFAKAEYKYLRYFGLADMPFEIGRMIKECSGDSPVERRAVKILTWEEAKTKAEIFGLDSMEL